jgi:predicted Zn-dependent protease
MRTYTTQLMAFLTTLFLMASCSKAPMTGRSQLKINFESELIRQGEQAYAELKTQNMLCRDKNIIETVNSVTNKLIQATDTYYRMNGQENKLARYKWEIAVFESAVANASCYPGGKIAVFTGIIPIALNEDGLAAIIGHEIGHALAGHANERVSHQKTANFGLTVLDGVMGASGKSFQTRQIVNAGGVLAAKFGFLMPFSRKHELEADEIGLYLMAIAGFEPSEAADVWARMEAKQGQSKGSFWTTHPSHDKRRERLAGLVDKAKVYAQVYDTKDNKREGIALTNTTQEETKGFAPKTNTAQTAQTLTSESPIERLEKITKGQKETDTSDSYYRIEVAYVRKENFREYYFRKGNLYPQLEAIMIPDSKMVRVVLKTVFQNKAVAREELESIKASGYSDAGILEYRKGELFGKFF